MIHAPEFRPWAVIPAKRFGRAKTRLGTSLPAAERRELARALFERALAACRGCAELHSILVATDGDDVAALAARRGAHVVRDREPAASLAAVVDGALIAARDGGATHALVVMADLPQIQARDLRELLALLRDADLVLAPDIQRRGTSALGLRLALGLQTAFGSGESLQRHLSAAARAGGRSRLLYHPRLALDVDTPEDFHALRGESSAASAVTGWSEH